MRTLLLLIVFSLMSKTTFSQNGTYFIGDITYPCSSTICFREVSKYDPCIILVKDGKKGMMIFQEYYFKVCGTIILYLDDNTTIKLFDRKQFDKVNDIYSVVYYLTEQEINILKTTNIKTIRFNIERGNTTPEARSVDNVEMNSPYKKVNFPKIVSTLFQ
jgi:hypothetical protein